MFGKGILYDHIAAMIEVIYDFNDKIGIIIENFHSLDAKGKWRIDLSDLNVENLTNIKIFTNNNIFPNYLPRQKQEIKEEHRIGLQLPINKIKSFNKISFYLRTTNNKTIYKTYEITNKNGEYSCTFINNSNTYTYKFEDSDKILSLMTNNNNNIKNLLETIEYLCIEKLTTKDLDSFKENPLITYNYHDLHSKSHQYINLSYINPNIIKDDFKNNFKNFIETNVMMSDNLYFSAGWKYGDNFIRLKNTEDTKNKIFEIIDNLDKIPNELDNIIENTKLFKKQSEVIPMAQAKYDLYNKTNKTPANPPAQETPGTPPTDQKTPDNPKETPTPGTPSQDQGIPPTDKKTPSNKWTWKEWTALFVLFAIILWSIAMYKDNIYRFFNSNNDDNQSLEA